MREIFIHIKREKWIGEIRLMVAEGTGGVGVGGVGGVVVAGTLVGGDLISSR